MVLHLSPDKGDERSVGLAMHQRARLPIGGHSFQFTRWL